MSIKRIVVCLLALVLLFAAPTTAVWADIASGIGSGISMGNAALSDISIWEDANAFHVMYKGVQKTLTLTERAYDYLVSVETCRDEDGRDVTIICFNLAFTTMVNTSDNGVRLGGNETDEDGDIYYNVYLCSSNSYSDSKYRARSYYVTVKDGAISDFVLARRGAYGRPSHVAMGGSNTLLDDTFYGRRTGRIYKSAFYEGDYTIYCSSPVLDENTSPYETLYPATPLPGTSPEGGEGGYPYKTTFRMLTGETTVYNTFYYTSSYMSSADEISASGAIRLDATKYADGSVTRTLLSAPQLLCQKSTYGTAYDIVYTNDDNLCSLLGVSKPAEKYWDVSSQEWKPVSSGGSGGGSEGSTGVDSSLLIEDAANLSPIKNLTVKLVGEDALIDAVRFNDYYAGHVGHDNMLEDLNTPVWGLGNYITWDYDGILYDPSDGGTLLTSYKNRRCVKLVVKAKFRLDATTTKTLTYTLYDYSTSVLTHGIAVGVGSWKVSFYDLCLYFQNAYPGYITDFPSQLQQVSYYLTPFYYDSDEGKYHYGKTSQVTQKIKSALADYSGGEWDGDDGGWSNVEDTSNFEWIWHDISNGISNVAGFIKNMLSSGEGIFYTMGQVPRMIGDVFSFIPTEVVTVIGVGLSLWFLPSLLGLAKQAMEAVGNVAVAAGGTIAKIIQAIIKAI